MANILWVDDEIALLKPHILFLESKGYQLTTVNNGSDALEIVESENFDLVFLDENMPGLSGLEVLAELKKIKPHLPVIMITKSEEESIMEHAIGSNIADYLIKPVNPNQILLSIKKNIDSQQIISNRNSMDYQMDFRKIGMEISDRLDYEEWITIYRRLIDWEMKLEKSEDSGILDVFQMQKEEANRVFSDFVASNYVSWVQSKAQAPVLSQTAFKELVLPHIEEKKPTFLFMIDNLRFDQWRTISSVLSQYFNTLEENIYYSILPTATQYARNAFFSGLMPSQIEKNYPQYWIQESEEGTKNQFEKELLQLQIKRLGFSGTMSYNKVVNLSQGKRLAESMHTLLSNPLNVIVYNFVDMLSHARTEMEVIKELASDEKAYRSITLSWFTNSPLFEMMRFVAEKGGKIIITTDHGSVRVKKAVKVLGDRNTNTNLRYKFGKNLDYRAKEVFEVKNPADVFLPKVNMSTTYVFCKESDFFVYPNNYNQFNNFYKDTFQHGGISLEEVLIPLIVLNSK